jgi:hypothetical protein
MRKNTRVKRIKHKGFWISVWVYRFIPTRSDYWEGAVCITKSKRASCDWIENRKNKRSRKTNVPHTGAPSTTVYKAMSLFKSLILELPENAVIFARPQSTSVEVISRYIERIGFIRSPLGAEPCWVLTTRSKEEALRQPMRNASKAA